MTAFETIAEMPENTEKEKLAKEFYFDVLSLIDDIKSGLMPQKGADAFNIAWAEYREKARQYPAADFYMSTTTEGAKIVKHLLFLIERWKQKKATMPYAGRTSLAQIEPEAPMGFVPEEKIFPTEGNSVPFYENTKQRKERELREILARLSKRIDRSDAESPGYKWDESPQINHVFVPKRTKDGQEYFTKYVFTNTGCSCKSKQFDPRIQCKHELSRYVEIKRREEEREDAGFTE